MENVCDCPYHWNLEAAQENTLMLESETIYKYAMIFLADKKECI